MKKQQEITLCAKCGEAKYVSDFYRDDWDKPDHKRCSECRKQDNTERVRRYRQKKKNQKRMNLDAFITDSLRTRIVQIGRLSCAYCGYAQPQPIQLIDPHGDADIREAIQIYITNPTAINWAETISVVSYLIPMCLNCIKISESGLFNLLDVEYTYTPEQYAAWNAYNPI